jgi:hypothetical protein
MNSKCVPAKLSNFFKKLNYGKEEETWKSTN